VTDRDIITLDRAEIGFEPHTWRFAAERRDDIDRYFAELQSQRSGVWNGRALLLHRYAVAGGVLRGACFEADYASLCAWREWMFPDPGIYNFFTAAALRSADGAWLIGEMAPDTAAAGLIYFPCGTPEPDDLGTGNTFDLDGNLRRELLEETGIDADELTIAPGWGMTRDRNYMGFLKTMTARQNADELKDRIMRYIAGETRPEFVDIRIVRGPADLHPRMAPFTVMFLQHVWQR
jgi:8-oxo-dGTP pyrophosphatase MutT (NUDIX family)